MYGYHNSYSLVQSDIELYNAAVYMIKLHPKYMSSKKLQAMMYLANKEHLTQYGRMIVDFEYYACAQGPYMPRLDKIITPGFFIKRNPRLEYN